MSYKNRPQSNIVGSGALGQALRPLIPVDLPVVFFCVKAFQLAQALTEQAALWPIDIPFVTFSNGFIAGEIEDCRTILGARPMRWGMTTMGAAFQEDGVLKVLREGSITAWGPYQAPTEPLFSNIKIEATAGERALIAANPGWYWHDDIVPTIRRKWIFNTVLNTMCGALRLSSNGKLINHRGLADAVLNEAYQLAAELWPQRAADLESLEILRPQFWDLVHKTSDNENSMVRDARLSRRTETMYLAGQSTGRRGYDRLKTYHGVLARFG